MLVIFVLITPQHGQTSSRTEGNSGEGSVEVPRVPQVLRSVLEGLAPDCTSGGVLCWSTGREGLGGLR